VTDFDAIAAVLSASPKASGVTYAYGTAGFRMKNDAQQLDCAIVRAALLACVHSSVTHGGRPVGLMITASHNTEPDNGVKMCEPDGEMLVAAWELHAVRLANCADTASAVALLKQLLGTAAPQPPSVFVARDTRRSSAHLSELVVRAVRAFHAQAELVDCGVQTTPQLHHYVRCKSANEPHAEADYYRLMAASFASVVGAAAPEQPLQIAVDCAFGVGSIQLRKLAALVSPQLLVLTAFNEAGSGALNVGCGAEHVQKALQLPCNVAPGTPGCFASLDGDADRIVFFGAQRGSLLLCDGDKIACLIAAFVREQLRLLPESLKARVGVVQTAYANGSAARFVRDVLGVELAVVKTGVKYLHHQAQEYDVGVYFEANGHGTVLFAAPFLERVRALPDSAPRTALLAASRLANQAVGDALGDLLLVAALLLRTTPRGADPIEHWAALYAELPSRQGKVSVQNRAVICTTDDETRTTAPAGLQELIDAACKSFGEHARAFVRPSGTEDIVRTYAEASTRELSDALEREVARVVFDTAGGVGQRR
jgi:phosphoacetylglucosamine mutase